ncbi:endonuclease domain-containing protein [Methylobacterium sp. sgz302541]|uniref:endonuclease domain-containing protein n=1 Tax=unclassified Methylobacterium TaxID=2615210 RepID=UPI003D33ED09
MPWNQDSSTFVSHRAVANAKTLRRHLTDPERRLWWHLRRRVPVEGSHFRRQVPIDSYVADFCCLSAKLVVELDGDQHGLDRALIYDAKRTRTLAVHGFRVLRFSNADVMTDIDTVLDTIFAALAPSGAVQSVEP